MSHPVEKTRIINAISPIACGLSTAVKGRYVSLKNVDKAYIIVMATSMGGAVTNTVTPYQATAVAGTSAKVFSTANPMNIWYTNGCSSDETLTKASTSYVDHTFSAATGEKQVIFEIPTALLDVASTFDCLGVWMSSGGSTNDGYAAWYWLEMRYAEADTPSVMID